MKRKTTSRATILLFTTVLLLTFMLGLNAALRRGRPTLSVSIEDIALEDSHFTMTASQGGNSGTSFRHSSYEIEDDTLYVTLFSGLVCRDFRADRIRVDIRENELDTVRQVYLRDGSAMKLIYCK